MSAQVELYDELQNKLREGLRILEEASDEDRDRLGLALIKLQAAFTDCVRLELSQKVPHLRLDGEDGSGTYGGDLISYGRQYLDFSESDIRTISGAHRHHQQVIRGEAYQGSRPELVTYAEFVNRWCTQSATRQDVTAPEEAVPSTVSQSAPPLLKPDVPAGRRPWYESPWLLIAFSAGFLLFFCIIGFLSYSETIRDLVRRSFRQAPIPQTSTATPQTLASPTFAIASTEIPCVIIWVEHPKDDLGQQTRSIVYELFVSAEVKESGMTPNEFYDQVVQHNPVLVQDDYEFKRGKKYLLPQCQ